jgi:hypothetical protein
MTVVEKKVSDSVIIITFSFSKDLATENFKYALSIGDNGEIHRDLGITPVSKKVKITLYHYSYMHNEESIDNLSNTNTIDYEDFINSEFKSFNTILNRASKIYMVDVKDQGNALYKAYEVKL